MKTIDDIQNVLVVGAGTLGMRIALRCALDGYKVKMFDINAAQLQTALDMQAQLTSNFLKKGMIDLEMVERAKSNLMTTSDINEAVTDIDLISESVIEDIDIKLDFYTDLIPRLEPGVIVTTNTSYLLPSNLLAPIKEEDHFCALHFHDVFHQVVVDVMPHPGTAQWVSDLLMEFGRRIHQIPVFIQKENPGYIFNTFLMGILGQAGNLALNEVGSIQDIDRSFMGNFKTPIGPFGMMDQIGLDTAWHVAKAQTGDQGSQFAALLKRYIDDGKLGFKSGEGFYKYPNPEFTDKNFLHGSLTNNQG